MELWIKTQSEGLHQIIGIDGLYVQKDYTALIGYSNYKHIELGVYKTEQRALEILDEIQSFIENNYESNIPSYSGNMIANGKIVLKTRQIVYDMPKE